MVRTVAGSDVGKIAFGSAWGINVVVDAYSPAMSWLFISIGLIAMLVCAFVARVIVFQK